MPDLQMIPASVWVGLSAVSILMFVGSLVALRFLIVRMPADYFVREQPVGGHWGSSHPAMRVVVTVVKNVGGGALVVLGLIMLLTPGQGVLLILVGVSLLDVPGKRAIELKIVRNPIVLRAINHIRASTGRPPIVVDEEHEHGTKPRSRRAGRG